MKYGLVGKKLGHSWSPLIHQALAGIDYEKRELDEAELITLLKARDFEGINVTIPYKETVIPYLDDLDPEAKEVGAVNCITNIDGRLIGHNTDVYGFVKMVEKSGIDTACSVAVLGSGGASKAACAGIRKLGGKPVVVSRHPKEDEISYEELYNSHFEVIVNTTPVGMAPHVEESPIDLDRLQDVHGVIDVIANPLVTKLMFEAKCRKIPYCGGFEMLLQQALRADYWFTGKQLSQEQLQKVRNKILQQKRNIVLIGMPAGGKTTVGRMTADLTGMKFIDMDELLEERMGMSIRVCFDQKGEAWFREQEHQLACDLAQCERTIISCGGGIIKDVRNMEVLQHNGLIVWVDRDPDLLRPTSSRPLSSSKGQMQALYEERHDLYARYQDVTIQNNSGLGAACRALADVMEGKA